MKTMNNRGIIPIIAIIAGVMAVGGVLGLLAYLMNNEPTLSTAVNEARTERAQQAQISGYPSLWVSAGLPQYSNATLTKTRQGSNLSEGVQVTLETSDQMSAIISYWNTQMSNRGFTQSGFPGTEYATMVRYTNGTKLLTLQVTKIGSGSNNKIHANYHE